MNTLRQNSFLEKLSLYVDGQLKDADVQEVERRMQEDAEVRSSVEELKRLKTLLAQQPKLEPHIGFWTRLSVELEDQKKEKPNLLPFPRRFVPLVSTSAVLVIVAVGVLVMQNKMRLAQFVNEKSMAAREVYQKSLLQGKVLPLFSKIDKDHALQFTLFGTLSLDEKTQTTLHVDANVQNGYRIEVGKGKRQPSQAVTVERMLSDVKPTNVQRRAIDSLLTLAGKRIESSVFVGENNAVAIAQDLPKLNKFMVTGIASCLEPAQRVRFEKYLAKNDAQFSVSTKHAPVVKAERIYQNIPQRDTDAQFVVITPDTVVYSRIQVDIQNIRRQMQENIAVIESRRNELIRRMMARDFNRVTRQFPIPQPLQASSPEDENLLRVEFAAPGEGQNNAFDQVLVVPRTRHSMTIQQVVTPQDQERARVDSSVKNSDE
jgi:hypothetical protein